MTPTHEVEITGSTVTKRYLSWSRDEPGREWAALTLISRCEPDLVPAPLDRAFTDGSGAPAPALSMTVVPGLPLSGALTRRQLDALSDALQTLWSIPPDSLPPIDLPALVERVRTGLAVLRDVPGVVGSAARAWLDAADDDLTDVPDPVVAHGDPNLENYLWDGTRVRIVDFEDAGRGDLAVELANLVEHLSARDTDWTGFAERFAVDPDRFHAARCLWAAFWLTLVGPGGPSAGRNPPGTAEAQAGRVLALVRRGLGGARGGRGRRGC